MERPLLSHRHHGEGSPEGNLRNPESYPAMSAGLLTHRSLRQLEADLELLHKHDPLNLPHEDDRDDHHDRGSVAGSVSESSSEAESTDEDDDSLPDHFPEAPETEEVARRRGLSLSLSLSLSLQSSLLFPCAYKNDLLLGLGRELFTPRCSHQTSRSGKPLPTG